MADKKGFLLYLDQEELLDDVSDEEAGQLLKAFFKYNKNEPFKMAKMTKRLFQPFKITFDRDKEKYEAICLKNKEKSEKYWNKKHNTKVSHGIQRDTVESHIDSDSDSDSDSHIDSHSHSDINNNKNKREREGNSVASLPRFVSPTFEEVVEYGKSLDRDKNYSSKFFNHYESKDWEGIKSWKAKMRYWDIDDKVKEKSKAPTTNKKNGKVIEWAD